MIRFDPMRARHLAIALLLALSGACVATTPANRPPPPTGRSFDDYLGGDKQWKAPAKPKDTVDADAMAIHFIDIGQGSAFLVEFPCGAMLIDTGGEQNAEFDGPKALFSYLDRFFERRTDLDRTFDLLVITHPHIDHTRGLLNLLERYKIRNVIDNGAQPNTLGGRPQVAMYQWLSEKGGAVGHQAIDAAIVDPKRGLTSAVIDPVHGCPAAATDPAIRALWGRVTTDVASYGDNPNDHSVVLRVDYGKSSVLFMGDLEKAGISRMTKAYKPNPALLDVDIYQVAHHGSKNSSTAYIIEEASPKLAVISAGPYERNLNWTARRFGHPHRIAIGHLIDPKHGISWRRPYPIAVHVGVKGAWKKRKEVFETRVIRRALYSTGWDGTVVVRANANGWIKVTTTREAPRAPAPRRK